MRLPQLFLFLVTVAGLAVAPSPLSAQNTAAAPAAGAASVTSAAVIPAATLIGYVQLAPPPILTKDIMAVARQIYPSPQTELLPMLMLARYGYPTFSEVSDQAPVIVLIFDSGGDNQNVVYGLQMTPTGPMHDALASLNIPLVTDSATGWTFLSTDAGLLAYTQAHAVDLVKLAGQPITVDLLLTMPASNLSYVRTSVQSFVHLQKGANGHPSSISFGANITATPGSDADSGLPSVLGKWMDFSLREMERLQSIQIGLDLKPDAINLTVSGTAQPGTPLAQFFSAPAGGPVPAAQFVSANATVLLLIHQDNPSVQALSNRLYADAQAASGPKAQEIFASLQKTTDQYFTLSDGTAAEAFSFSVSGAPRADVLAGGNFTDATLIQFMQTMYGGLMSALMKEISAATGNLLAMNSTLTLTVGNIGNIPVHEVNSTTSNPAAAGGATAQSSSLPPANANGNQTSNVFFAAVNGYYASSDSLTNLTGLVTAVQSNQPVPNSIASVFSLAPGQLTAGRINFAQMMADSLASRNKNSPANGTASVSPDAIAALRAAGLPPITFSVTTGSNQGQFELSVPIATLIKVQQAQQAPPPRPAPAPSSGNTTSGSSATPSPSVVSPATDTVPSGSSN